MNWRPWLELWSEEWITAGDPGELDSEVVRQRWLGYAPAAEADVAAAEERLGVRLPPSYRSFLLTTDGWRHAGEFVREMRDTSDLGWLRDLDPRWESWADLAIEAPVDAPGDPFTRGLLISRHAGEEVLFLDPADRDENGEWAAYSVCSWGEFPQRHPSFTSLMESLYRSFHQIRRPAGATRDSWDLVVEQAREEALSGNIDAAMTALEKAQEFGRPRSTVLGVQLQMFLATSAAYEASRLLSRLLAPDSVPDGFFTGSLFTEEFLPCVFLQHTRKEPWYGSALEIARSRADGALAGHRVALEIGRQHADDESSPYSALEVARILENAENDEGLEIGSALDEHQARVQQPGYHLSYGNPAFDTAVRNALAEHHSDPATLWQALEAAMAHWQPRTPDHIAPVALLADPVLADSLTPERGRALLRKPRSGREPREQPGG
ncbi:SMI1/KNR4 family protein [Nocardia flavorosea]|uniref:SMI1/KNR4 family protein n=1 Tax=Nocardia flavorosea TaxID=53429 RepID=UPI0018940BB4|nr:SMI1/KNR4 family protein [Nocardia flavorosea]MBF6352905.1 SMI1/KNR4 family protein [Nocardia flavorosea]